MPIIMDRLAVFFEVALFLCLPEEFSCGLFLSLRSDHQMVASATKKPIDMPVPIAEPEL